MGSHASVPVFVGAKKKALLDQLAKDAKFLAQHNIMDYSLLVSDLYHLYIPVQGLTSFAVRVCVIVSAGRDS